MHHKNYETNVRPHRAQITSGWKSHSRSYRYDWIADGPFRRVNRRDGTFTANYTSGRFKISAGW